TLKGHGDKPIVSLAFTTDSKKLVSGTFEDRTLKVWDTTTGKELLTISDPGPLHQAPVLATTPDGKQVLVWDHGTGLDSLEVYDLATGKQEQSWNGHERTVESLAFSSDGELAALGGNDGSVRVWQIAKKERLAGGDLPAH